MRGGFRGAYKNRILAFENGSGDLFLVRQVVNANEDWSWMGSYPADEPGRFVDVLTDSGETVRLHDNEDYSLARCPPALDASFEVVDLGADTSCTRAADNFARLMAGARPDRWTNTCTATDPDPWCVPPGRLIATGYPATDYFELDWMNMGTAGTTFGDALLDTYGLPHETGPGRLG